MCNIWILLLFYSAFAKCPPPCVKRSYVSRPRVPASSTTRVFMLCDRPPDAHGLGGTQVHAAALVRERPRASTSSPRIRRAEARGDGAGLDAAIRWPSSRSADPPSDPLSPWPELARALEVSLLALGADVFSLQAPQFAPGRGLRGDRPDAARESRSRCTITRWCAKITSCSRRAGATAIFRPIAAAAIDASLERAIGREGTSSAGAPAGRAARTLRRSGGAVGFRARDRRQDPSVDRGASAAHRLGSAGASVALRPGGGARNAAAHRGRGRAGAGERRGASCPS